MSMNPEKPVWRMRYQTRHLITNAYHDWDEYWASYVMPTMDTLMGYWNYMSDSQVVITTFNVVLAGSENVIVSM